LGRKYRGKRITREERKERERERGGDAERGRKVNERICRGAETDAEGYIPNTKRSGQDGGRVKR